MAAHRPLTRIVVETRDGARYGFADQKTAAKHYPDGRIVGFQDGAVLDTPIPVTAPKKDAGKDKDA